MRDERVSPRGDDLDDPGARRREEAHDETRGKTDRSQRFSFYGIDGEETC
jgi:hypothetical protein